MMELITTPVSIVTVILLIGFIIEVLNKGLDNISRKETIIFIVCVFALIFILTLG